MVCVGEALVPLAQGLLLDINPLYFLLIALVFLVTSTSVFVVLLAFTGRKRRKQRLSMQLEHDAHSMALSDLGHPDSEPVRPAPRSADGPDAHHDVRRPLIHDDDATNEERAGAMDTATL